jgi:hypothetical protein
MTIGTAQVKSPASKYAISAAFDPNYKAPRTPYGQPDLQGVYNNFTLTPESRPAEFANKEFFTEAEARDIEQQAVKRPCRAGGDLRYVHQAVPMSMEEALEVTKKRRAGYARGGGGPWMPCNIGLPIDDPGGNLSRGFQGEFYDFGKFGPSLTMSRRTSIVVDPPDGRMPARTAAAQQLSIEADAREDLKRDATDLPNSLRCLVGDQGSPQVFKSFPYSNFVEIFQSKDYVVFRPDYNTYPHVVALNNRAPLPNNLRQWSGDSHGHWEGETLVIETDHFRPDAEPRGGIPPGHFTERITRIAPDYLLYEFTHDNPAMYAKPYTLQYYPKREKNAEVFEYACHEGNANLSGELSEKRRLEQALTAKKK